MTAPRPHLRTLAGRHPLRRGTAALPLLACLVLPVTVVAQDPGGLERAREAAWTGQYEQALQVYDELAGGGSVAAARERARLLREMGRYDDAVRSVSADGTGGGRARSIALEAALGQALAAVGRLDEAEDAFRREIDGGAPDRNVASKELAVLLWTRGERERAREIFDSFIDLYNRGGDLTADELMAVGTAVRYLGRETPALFQDALMAYDEAAAAAPGDPRPRVLAGDLFLAKYNSPEAHASFDEVLARNAGHPRALLGKARARDFDGTPGAMETARRALETNPNSPDVRAFIARLHLKTEQHAEAEREAERALEVNPAHLDALSVLAASHYLRGDMDGWRRLRDRALALAPSHAELFATVAELAADQRQYGRAVELARQGVALDSTSTRALGLLGINQLRTQSITEGTRNLERAFESDPYNVWYRNTLELLDTFDRYETIRTEHFEIFLPGEEAELLGPYAGRLAEEAYSTLRNRYGAEPPTPIRIEIFASHADFAVRTLGLPGLGAQGVSFGSTIVMDGPSALDPGQFNWASTLWHEVVHAFHLGMTDHRVPRWFSEGLAVHEQRSARPWWGHRPTVGWLQAYASDRMHPVSRLNEGFVRPAYPEQVVFSYYQSSLVFEFIEGRWGFGPIREMLEGYRDGATTPQLVRRVLGLEPEALDRAFDEWVRARMGTWMAAVQPLPGEAGGAGLPGGLIGGGAPGGGDVDTLRRLARQRPGSYQARLRLGRALYEAGETEAAEEELRTALELFPEDGSPESAYRWLAHIHLERGDTARAADLLHQLARRNESAYQLHAQEASLRSALGEPEPAARALERAVEIFPYEPEMHERLASLYEELGNHRGAVLERRAILALDPVDRADAHYRLARAHLLAGDREAARTQVLRSLEIAPGFEAALELLLEIRGGNRP